MICILFHCSETWDILKTLVLVIASDSSAEEGGYQEMPDVPPGAWERYQKSPVGPKADSSRTRGTVAILGSYRGCRLTAALAAPPGKLPPWEVPLCF